MYDIGMYKYLRIICCVISALILAACVFIFIYCGMAWGLAALLAAALFFGLTVFFKYKQEEGERKENPPPRRGDFITGPVPKDGDEEK